MERVEPTRKIAFRFCWALAWRFALCLALIGLLHGFMVGLLSSLLELSAQETDTLSGVLTILIGVPLALAASWECLYRILGTRIGDYELILARHDR